MTTNSIVIIDDEERITFSDLHNLINGTAKYFLNNGVKSHEYIPILSDNSLQYVVTIFALWKISAIPVPINTRLRDEEVLSIVNIVGCSKIIKSSEFNEFLSEFPSIEMKIESKSKLLQNRNGANLNDTAVIIHTSGTSGKPKGVEITNNNLFQSYLSETKEFHYSSSDCFLASLPFYHIGGIAIINRALLSGGTLVVPRSLKQNDIVDSMLENNPSIISLVPTVIKRLIDSGASPNRNLRHLFLGGGASDDKLISAAFKNGWPVVKVFGSSETTAMVTACYGEELEQHPSSAGKSLDGVEIKILDETKKNINVKMVGEIAIKSPTIAKGYLNNELNWNDKIHDGYYLTGDYGYLDEDDKLFVVARRADLIVSGGENINPREIEKLINEQSAVSESFVFPIENEEWGQIPVAIILLKKDFTLERNKIIADLKLRLASFKIPKKIVFAKEIPKTEMGKVNIEEIKRLYGIKN